LLPSVRTTLWYCKNKKLKGTTDGRRRITITKTKMRIKSKTIVRSNLKTKVVNGETGTLISTDITDVKDTTTFHLLRNIVAMGLLHRTTMTIIIDTMIDLIIGGVEVAVEENGEWKNGMTTTMIVEAEGTVSQVPRVAEVSARTKPIIEGGGIARRGTTRVHPAATIAAPLEGADFHAAPVHLGDESLVHVAIPEGVEGVLSVMEEIGDAIAHPGRNPMTITCDRERCEVVGVTVITMAISHGKNQ
jgi:hypothetical protein